MGTQITFRRGSSFPTQGSGITLAEPVFETTLHTFHIGLGYGVTAEWVGAPISGLSADIGAGITYKIPTAASVLNYISGLCYGNTGAVTITQYVSSFNGSTGAVQGVSSFNGLTGAVGGVCAAQANTFTALQSFGSGISASGITVNGNMSVTGNFTVSGGVTFTTSETVLIEDNIITLNSNVTGSPSENAGIEIERGTSANVQLLWNESSDRWTFTNDGSTYYDLPTSVVTSFNGRTGAVQGVSSAAAGTGISVSAATGAVTITNTGVLSFNGSTGAIVGVNSVRGLTGAIGITNGSGIGLSVSGQTMTFSNTGVLSIDGGTGAITNVARTNVTNNFSTSQNVNGSIVASNPSFSVTVSPTKITFYEDSLGFSTDLYTGQYINQSIYLPSYTTTLAGLSGDPQTFTGTNIFNSIAYFNGGISAAGATFSSLARFNAGISAAGGTFSGTQTFVNGATFQGNINAPNIVTSFNGSTGAVQGVSSAAAGNGISVSGSTGAVTITNIGVQSFNGLTGAVQGVSSAAAGNGISVSGSTGAVTITNIGVLSFNGSTGAVGGVCAASSNTFTALQTFSSGFSGDANIVSTNATGNMYLMMARGAGVTTMYVDNATTPLVYQPSAGNLGLKGITLSNGNDYLYITPTQITATNTATPTQSFFYFIAQGGNYLQSQNLSQIGDIGAVGQGLGLSIDPSTRQLTWGDIVNSTGAITGYFGVNRNFSNGLCGDYAVEINHPTGKGLQLIYNDFIGAASNWVNMDVSSSGNYTVRPSGGLATVTGTLNVSAGVCAAGGTFSSLTQFTAGISAAGATLSASTVIPSGSTLSILGTVTGNVVSSVEGMTGDVVLPAVDLYLFDIGIV